MKKLHCRICEHDKPETEFAPRKDTKRGRRSECRPCGKGLSKTYYRANRKRVIARVTRRRRRG